MTEHNECMTTSIFRIQWSVYKTLNTQGNLTTRMSTIENSKAAFSDVLQDMCELSLWIV